MLSLQFFTSCVCGGGECAGVCVEVVSVLVCVHVEVVRVLVCVCGGVSVLVCVCGGVSVLVCVCGRSECAGVCVWKE